MSLGVLQALAVLACSLGYVGLVYGCGAWLGWRHTLRVDHRFLVRRLGMLSVAVVVPGLVILGVEHGLDDGPPSWAGPIVSGAVALVLLCVSLWVLLDGTIALQDDRRALVGRDLEGVLGRMKQRAARTRGAVTAAGAAAYARQVLDDAGTLLLAGAGDDAVYFAADALAPVTSTTHPPPQATPDWAHEEVRALRALHQLAESRDPNEVVAALPQDSDDPATAALLHVVRALALGLGGTWHEARQLLPRERPSTRLAALIYDLVSAHSDPHPKRSAITLSRISPSALRERVLRLWPGPASRRREGPFRD